MSPEPRKPTTYQRLVEALTLLNCWEDTGRSRVWRIFRHDLNPNRWYFLGKGGALRVGTTMLDYVPSYQDKIRLLKLWEDHQKAIITKKASNL